MEKNYGSHIDFPSNWKVERLKDNFSIYPTASYSRADLTEDGPVKYIHYGDIHTQFDFHLDVQKNNLPRITEEQIKKYQLVEEGDLVIADASEDYEGVGKAVEVINVNNEKVIAGLHTFLIRDNAKVFAPKFKGYALLSSYVREQMYRLATGTKVYSISKESLKDIKIPVPPIEEQNAIANCLSTWDEAIEKQQKLIEAKEIRHKALMQKLLSGKKRLPGFTEEWKFVRFKEFYSENKKQLGNDKLEVLSVTKNGIVSQSEYFNKEIASSDTSKYLIVEKDDFVVSGLNFWMGSFDVLTNFDIGVVSPAYKVFRLNKEFNNLYFKFLSKSKLMLDAMVGASIIGASIVRRNFDKEILYEWTFKIPSLEEQKKIGEFLENSSREIEIEKQKLDQLKEQKKALMQKLLTGKVRLPLNN